MTYEETMIEILMSADYPMRAKDLIKEFKKKRVASPATLRQSLMLACNKLIIYRVKLDGFASFYCLPKWFNGSFLMDSYKAKIYESKQIQVQQPANRMGGSTRLPVQQREVNP